MTDEHVIIYTASNAAQATMLKNALADEGIRAHVVNTHLEHGEGADPAVVGPQVLVHPTDALEARLIALQFEHASKAGTVHPELRELEEQADRDAAPWPACPHCQRARLTSCPVCEHAASEFPRAFMPEDEYAIDRGHFLVLCPACDEPFVPEFLARCEWCGHRFADGRQQKAPASQAPLDVDLNWRVWLVLATILMAVAALAAIFTRLAPGS